MNTGWEGRSDRVQIAARRLAGARRARVLLKELTPDCRPTSLSLGDNMSELARWDSFYVIVGTAAGALIGLQFVVMTLIADRPPLRTAEAGAAFASPTIVHFGTALLLSALLALHGQRSPSPQFFGASSASVG